MYSGTHIPGYCINSCYIKSDYFPRAGSLMASGVAIQRAWKNYVTSIKAEHIMKDYQFYTTFNQARVLITA